MPRQSTKRLLVPEWARLGSLGTIILNFPMEALPVPTAEGLLAKTPLAHVFIYVMERRMTGSLELRSPDGAAGVLVFVEGIPRKARTPDGTATLGMVLVEHQVITQEAANESIDRRFSTGTLQGQVLVGMGAITGDTLLAGLVAQLEAKILCLFEFPFESHFAFYEGRDLLEGYGGIETVEADPLRVLWAGIRQNPSWDHVNVTIARVQNMGLRLQPHAAPERCAFSGGELQAVELLGQRAVRITDLTAARYMTPSVAQLFVYFFLITKQLELVEAPAPSTRPDRISVPPAKAQVARVQLQARQVTRGPAIVEEHRPLRPDSRMSPVPQAYPIPEELRGAVVPAAPPVPHDVAPVSFSFGANGPPSPRPSEMEESGPPSSVRPPTSQSRMPAAPTSVRPLSASRMPVAAQDTGPKSAPPASVRASLSGAEGALRSKILSKAEAVDSQSHYEILGVSKSAPKEDVQKAFFTLAKVWHPDKLPAALGEVRDACSKVFSRLSEAHSVLMDPARRGDYDKALRDGTGSLEEQQKVQEVLEASNNFQKALIFLKRNDTSLGEELARKALAADPTQADYLALVTWLDSQKPANQHHDKTHSLIAKLDEAIKMNGNCERAHYYRGMLHKRVDNMKQAMKDLKRAVELNPHNLDAAREIRLHSMRSAEAKAPKNDSIGGLFGKLFKK